MRIRDNLIYQYVLAVLFISLLGCASVPVKPIWSPENEKIFQWVVEEIHLDSLIVFTRVYIAERPAIYKVNMETVRSKYRDLTKEAFRKFYEDLIEHGKTPEEARTEVELWLAAPGAFFNPRTDEIYIGTDGLTKCRIGARIAHEVLHFIQVKPYGRIPPGTPDMSIYRTKMIREGQATMIERAFGRHFCYEESQTWEFHL